MPGGKTSPEGSKKDPKSKGDEPKEVGDEPKKKVAFAEDADLDPNAEIGKVHFMVDLESRHVGLAEMKSGLVGHTWVSLELNDTKKVPSILGNHANALKKGGKYADTFGFWPDLEGLHTDDGRGVGYKQNPFKSYVQGHMRNPDDAHQGQEKATMTYPVTLAQAQAAIAYGDSKLAAQYSVYFYNCTTFAKEFVEAAGQSAPSVGSGIAMPDKAYDGVLALAKKGKEGAEVQGGVDDNEAYVRKGDIGVKWKQHALSEEMALILQKPNVLEVVAVTGGSTAEGKLAVGDLVGWIDGVRCNSTATYDRAMFGRFDQEVEFGKIDAAYMQQMQTWINEVPDERDERLKQADEDDKVYQGLCDDVMIKVGRPLDKKAQPKQPKGEKGKGGKKGGDSPSV